ncbi:hypothetical protein SRHO_G00215220 [Serrasalmus rhombeus]
MTLDNMALGRVDGRGQPSWFGRELKRETEERRLDGRMTRRPELLGPPGFTEDVIIGRKGLSSPTNLSQAALAERNAPELCVLLYSPALQHI